MIFLGSKLKRYLPEDGWTDLHTLTLDSLSLTGWSGGQHREQMWGVDLLSARLQSSHWSAQT